MRPWGYAPGLCARAYIAHMSKVRSPGAERQRKCWKERIAVDRATRAPYCTACRPSLPITTITGICSLLPQADPEWARWVDAGLTHTYRGLQLLNGTQVDVEPRGEVPLAEWARFR